MFNSLETGLEQVFFIFGKNASYFKISSRAQSALKFNKKQRVPLIPPSTGLINLDMHILVVANKCCL